MFDKTVVMNNYMLNNPNVIGRKYVVEKFNKAFNMNRNYKYFINKLDELKKIYKRWKELMNSTGISIDLVTSMIHAFPKWWKEREFVCTHKISCISIYLSNLGTK